MGHLGGFVRPTGSACFSPTMGVSWLHNNDQGERATAAAGFRTNKSNRHKHKHEKTFSLRLQKLFGSFASLCFWAKFNCSTARIGSFRSFLATNPTRSSTSFCIVIRNCYTAGHLTLHSSALPSHSLLDSLSSCSHCSSVRCEDKHS